LPVNDELGKKHITQVRECPAMEKQEVEMELQLKASTFVA
jgi:hypothetical protein